MAGFQSVIISGRVGREVETRQVGDVQVASFSVAVGETYKDKQGQKQERTTWFNVTLWRGLAEVADKYVKKGDLILIQGKIQTREYEDKDKVKRQSWDLVGDQMQMLGGKSDSDAAKSSGGGSKFTVNNDEPDDLPF